MARLADTNTGGGAPFAKFNALGDTLIGAFAGGKSRQQRDFKTQELVFKKSDPTKPALEEVMHFVAMPGTTAYTGTAEDPQPIEVGAHVRYAVSGFKWGQVIDQRKELPARAGFPAGKHCSGDVYTITLVGWSTETPNPAAATKAGFTVVESRIVMTTDADHERYVLAQLKTNGNTNCAKDFEITVRRPHDDEKAWEQAADALFDTKPWEAKAAAADTGDNSHDDDESF